MLRHLRQKHVEKITVFVFAGDPFLRKSTTGLVAQIGNHTVKSGSTLQSLTASSVAEAEFYAVVKGIQVGLSVRSVYQDLGIPMKIGMQSESSTANSLTNRLGAGQRTKHIDTRFFFRHKNEFKMETSVSRKCLRRKTAQMLERCQSLLQHHNDTASSQDWYSIDHGSHTPRQDEGDEPMMDLVTGLETRCEHRDPGRSTSTETDSWQR